MGATDDLGDDGDGTRGRDPSPETEGDDPPSPHPDDGQPDAARQPTNPDAPLGLTKAQLPARGRRRGRPGSVF
jgi:hypothetical protein